MAKGIKTGGRKKGTPNRVSGTIKEMLNTAICKELETLPKLLSELEPKERLDAIIKLLPYLTSKAKEDDSAESPAEKFTSFSKMVAEKMKEANERMQKKAS
ncbi:hypothetical protein ACUNWD_14710 [Sunxiuqinia sp. A32]|uniref:hypothetical protein n=1 Tax=Sunxiuqinia sp. A32 TaxID=3461496 RepID=UPI00404536A7